MTKLSERILSTTEEGGAYWDGDVDDNTIEEWGHEVAQLEAEVERLGEHLDRLWTYLRGFEPFRTWMEEQDALQESEE